MPAGKCSNTHREYQGHIGHPQPPFSIPVSPTETQTIELIMMLLQTWCCVCQCNSHLWICSRICPCCSETRCSAICRYCYRRPSFLRSAREPQKAAGGGTSSTSKDSERERENTTHLGYRGADAEKCFGSRVKWWNLLYRTQNSPIVAHFGSKCKEKERKPSVYDWRRWRVLIWSD